MTDPIADMLTRIRNAIQIERPFVEMPASRTKIGIADALKREGYIWDYEVLDQEPQRVLRIQLKYGPNGERIVQRLERTSKPGRRIYSRSTDIPQILQGMGVCILSTNKGVLSSREAKQQGVGGEILCTVW
ncbi:MAG TPA: 30S ribosomal protein S8 [Planctomycetaceae bacterium]|nr:30S ribosomal protein S8 [Planctomycetaceae bacterium]